LFFEANNVAGPKKKILEFNEELKKISDLIQFESFCKVLGEPQYYHSSSIGVKMHECMKQLLDFPVAKVFPCIDLYRLYLIHPDSTAEFTKSDMGA
jgi:hypothetical protein